MASDWLNDSTLEIAKVAQELGLTKDNEGLRIFAEAIALNPPVEGDSVIDFVTIVDLGRGGGKSKKTGNIIVNFKSAVSTGLIAATGGFAAAHIIPPSLLTCLSGLLVLCLRLQALENIKLDQEHAVLIYALFRHVDGRNQIGVASGFEVAVQCFKIQNLPALDLRRYENILKELVRMRIIKTDGNIITLVEEVRLAR